MECWEGPMTNERVTIIINQFKLTSTEEPVDNLLSSIMPTRGLLLVVSRDLIMLDVTPTQPHPRFVSNSFAAPLTMSDSPSLLPRVIAVYSTKDTSSALSQQLCCVSLESIGADRNGLITASQLRSHLSSSSSLPKHYSFVTKGGWEITEEYHEQIVTINEMLCEGNIIKIRPRHTVNGDYALRVGLIYHKIPLCVLFVSKADLNRTLVELRQLIKTQHPDVYSSVFQDKNPKFLDINGWPITTNQEPILLITAVLSDNTIHLTKPVHGIVSHPMSLPSPADDHHTAAQNKTQSIITPSEQYVHKAPPLSQGSKSPSFIRKSAVSSEIMVSYVHKEASGPAARLSEELTKLGFSVFLDKNVIKPGDDWQDVLNEAVCHCQLFVPIVTPLYGLTEWTNKEVKLADTLGKFIIPVTFLPKWPPMCLAIQFATTQYIKWNTSSEKDGTHFALNAIVNTVAAEISDQYKGMKTMMKEKEEKEEGEEEKKTVESNTNKEEAPKSMRKGSKLSLPRSLPEMIRKSIFKQENKSFIVVSYHPAQLEFVEGLRHDLESRGFEVWASMAGDDLQKREIFTKKVNVAGVVVFVLSQEYVASSSCEQEVYYVEGRKRIIPIIVNSFQIPGWMSTLIGPDNFLDSRSPSFQETFMEEVECATVPAKAEGRLRKLVEQKTKLHKLCADLKKKLPKGKLVYITGSSTKVLSDVSIGICEEFGKLLAREKDYFIVTGGFYGVGETVGQSFHKECKVLGRADNGVIHIQAIKDPEDHTMNARQNSDGTFQPLPYGETHFYCDTVRQRQMLIPKVIDLCILIEGGPSAAFEAHQFSWSGHTVIPVVTTGGAAGGKYNAPPGIFYKPHYADESDWSVLSSESPSPTKVASALVNIVKGHYSN